MAERMNQPLEPDLIRLSGGKCVNSDVLRCYCFYYFVYRLIAANYQILKNTINSGSFDDHVD